MQSFWPNNLIKTETCCTKNHKSAIDLFLSNRLLSFQKTRTTETEISDYHKFILTFLKSHYTRLKPKIIYYRNYKNFNEELFLKDLENSNLSTNSDNPHENYTNLSQTFSKDAQKHALREKCPNTEYFLVCIFPNSDWKYLSVFSPNAGKYGPEKTPYLDTFHAVTPH